MELSSRLDSPSRWEVLLLRCCIFGNGKWGKCLFIFTSRLNICLPFLSSYRQGWSKDHQIKICLFHPKLWTCSPPCQLFCQKTSKWKTLWCTRYLSLEHSLDCWCFVTFGCHKPVLPWTTSCIQRHLHMGGIETSYARGNSWYRLRTQLHCSTSYRRAHFSICDLLILKRMEQPLECDYDSFRNFLNCSLTPLLPSKDTRIPINVAHFRHHPIRLYISIWMLLRFFLLQNSQSLVMCLFAYLLQLYGSSRHWHTLQQ